MLHSADPTFSQNSVVRLGKSKVLRRSVCVRDRERETEREREGEVMENELKRSKMATSLVSG